MPFNDQTHRVPPAEWWSGKETNRECKTPGQKSGAAVHPERVDLPTRCEGNLCQYTGIKSCKSPHPSGMVCTRKKGHAGDHIACGDGGHNYKCWPNSEQTVGRADKVLGGSSRIMGLARVLVGILFFAMLHNPGQAFSAPLPDPYSLTLTWDPSPSPEVVGYHLYYGAESGNYTNNIVISNVTTVTVSGLSSGVTYYFALTAISLDGQESDFSNEVTYRQELSTAQMQIHSVSDGQFMLTVTGPADHTYDIEATEDFTTWTVIGTVTVDASGSFDFTDINAADFPQRFYRTRDTQP